MTCYLFLKHQARQVRREVKHQIIAGIDKDELTLLRFTQDELVQLKWKHEKEFEYNGHMYDIVETELKGDTTYYWCWWDHKETKLNKQLTQLLNDVLSNHPERNREQNKVVAFYKSLYCSEFPNWRIYIPEYKESINEMEYVLTSIAFPPPTPPPDKV